LGESEPSQDIPDDIGAPLRARFDDLRPGIGSSLGFAEADLVAEIAATTESEVTSALRRVDAEVARGRWAAGFVAYEAAPAFDPAMRVPGSPPDGLPLLWFGVFDRPAGRLPPTPALPYRLGSFERLETRRVHEAAVNEIRERIAAGDVYQVNHTMRLIAGFEGDGSSLYHDLAGAQDAEFNAYLRLGRFEVLSASPELFFLRTGRRVITRPMKGTAPRGRWREDDEARRDRLLASEKDRAENVMIVDLLRNDLGRVARFGTVRVDSLLEAERYPTLWQLTSTISGEVPESIGTAEVFAALFPCGSVTGAPKISATSVIAGLETQPRGVYCGAIGYLAPPGEAISARFSVAIRTVVVDRVTSTAVYGTGGGITYDSTPSGEYDEALLKAEILTERRPRFSVLETMRWEPTGGYPLLDDHLRRLEGSAGYFGYPCDLVAVGRALEEAVRGRSAAAMVRCLLHRNGRVETGVRDAPPTGEPARVAVDTTPIDTTSPFLYHKTTHRTVYDDALGRHPGADDVLLVNPEGEITEATAANVAVRLGDEWITPPLAAGCLPGVYRAAMLREGRLREGRITLDDLAGADEVALLNAVRFWRPATLL
jgi:para-aminobenzoate synthetase/4-amino-4-deoxychorismate lyase